MTAPPSERPTVEQMWHLIGHTEYRPLSPAEHARLRGGFEQLMASQAGQRVRVDDLAPPAAIAGGVRVGTGTDAGFRSASCEFRH